jgi:hypothetical protein
MNSSLDCDLPTQPSPVDIKDRAAYTIALACLLFFWAVFSLATVILAAALLVPGHLGLADLLQALGKLLPTDAPNIGWT